MPTPQFPPPSGKRPHLWASPEHARRAWAVKLLTENNEPITESKIADLLRLVQADG